MEGTQSGQVAARESGVVGAEMKAMRGFDRRLHDLIEPAVAALGFELIGVEVVRSRNQGQVRVYIDSQAGVTVDDCARVSYQVSGVLDVEDPVAGHYVLEVSSPGLDRPLVKSEHFERHVGCLVRVIMDVPFEGRRKFRGELRGLRGERLCLIEDGVEWAIPLDSVRKVRLVPELGLGKVRGNVKVGSKA